jgi:tetratricopeptide (TPR) repeat protein
LLLSRQFQPWEGGEGAALGQYMRAHLLLAVECLERKEPLVALDHLFQGFDPPTSLAESRHVLANGSEYAYWLGVAMEQAGDPAAIAQWENAASARGDFQQMEVKQISEATYWSGVALQRLGREDEARDLFAKVLKYADDLESRQAVIDFFATSLPTMLLFEEDIDIRQKLSAAFLRAQAKIGLGEEDGISSLRSVLARDPNHIGAIDMLRSLGR